MRCQRPLKFFSYKFLQGYQKISYIEARKILVGIASSESNTLSKKELKVLNNSFPITDLDKPFKENKLSILHVCNYLYCEKLIRYFLNQKANCMILTYEIEPPLFCTDDTDIIQLYINSFGDVKSVINFSYDNYTLLYSAVVNRDEELISFLLSKGADPHKKCLRLTPAEFAERRNLTSIIQLLQNNIITSAEKKQ